MFVLLLSAGLAAIVVSPPGSDAHTRTHQDAPPPRILLDQPPRAVEYQLNRLSNDQLVRVERRDDDVKYRPVYFALLTRKGVPRQFRDEALAALTKLETAGPIAVLLEALGKVPADDTQTGDQLAGILFGQPAEKIRGERPALAQAIDGPGSSLVLRGAYGGMMIADSDPGPAWQMAVRHEGHLIELLRSVPLIGNAEVRAALFAPIVTLLDETRDARLRAAAAAALGWTRRDKATFDRLAREILQSSDPDTRAAAIRSLQLIPESEWPAAQLEPLARAIVALVKDTAPDRRTEPAAIDAVQLGERLAGRLPDEPRRSVRRDLRALGVRVVRIDTVPEQLMFDVKWFVAEAGRPVQIVLSNPDAMPHNLVVSMPGSLKEVAAAAAALPPPGPDPDVKPYVPDSPLVLHATRLLNAGDTERLNFTAPATPGEYVYLCTFPGHWVRMYGVMLVVGNLEAWEAKPTPPTDPMTNRPFESQRK